MKHDAEQDDGAIGPIASPCVDLSENEVDGVPLRSKGIDSAGGPGKARLRTLTAKL